MSRGYKDIVKDTVEAVQGFDVAKDDEEVINNIEGIISQLNGKNLTGASFNDYGSLELSRIAGSLAIYKANLGEMISRYQRNWKATEHSIKLRKVLLRDKAVDSILAQRMAENKGNEKSVKKPTVADIDAFLDKQTYREQSISIFREEMYTKVLYLWRSVNSILDVVSQRIQILTSDRADSKFYDTDLDMDLGDLSSKQEDTEIKTDEELGLDKLN